MPARDSTWITTTEAAQRLGVKRATLYAYVSRGLLRSERRPGQQQSLFDRSAIEALASSTRPASSPQPVLRFRSVATAISSQSDGELFYRGVPLTEVADQSLADAVSLVLDARGHEPASVQRPDRVLAQAVSRMPLERRLPMAVQVQAAADPFANDLDGDRVRTAALSLVPCATAVMVGRGAAAATQTSVDDLPSLLLAGLRGRGGTPAEVALLRLLLIALLDHGLTASTVAARVAASTRAGAHDCLAAAYAAMAGPLHGAAPIAAHGLLAADAPASAVVAAAVRSRGHVAGFGHFLYPDGDPRAELVMAAVRRTRGTARVRRRVDELAAVVSDRTGQRPNIDLATAAVLHTLDLPATAGEVVFQVARSFGVVAHVLEEYTEQPLRWRGREATG